MEVLNFTKSRKVLASLAIISLLAGSLSFAQMKSSSEFVIETLNVFPDNVTANGWDNVDTVVSQNLDDNSLYQDFNIFNSATLQREDNPRPESKPPVAEIETNPDSVPGDEVIVADPDVEENAVEESGTEPEPVEESTEPIPAAEDPAETETEPVVFGFPRASNSNLFMQASNEVEIQATDNVPAPEVENVSEDIVEEEDVSQVNVEEVIEENTDTTIIDETTSNVEDLTASSSEDISALEEAEVSTPSAPLPPAPLPAQTMQMSGFDMPLFNTGELGLDGGQLRVSLAAKKKPGQEEQYAAIGIEYSFDNGNNWAVGGEVVIDEEVSNSINGGYYLFALPDLSNADQLKNLQVRLIFLGNRDAVRDVFVESAWLELFTYSELATDVNDFLGLFDDNYKSLPLSGDALTLENGEEISFDFTDNNAGETLIIKSDSVSYEGLTKATTYFNVTNESSRPDTINLRSYFPVGTGTVTSLEEWNQNKPKEVTIPEYRPVVYHCEAGWESTDVPAFDSVLEFSRSFGSSTIAEQVIAPYQEAINNEPAVDVVAPIEEQVVEVPTEEVLPSEELTPVPLEETPVEVIPAEPAEAADDTLIEARLISESPFTQASSEVDTVVDEASTEALVTSEEGLEDVVENNYLCRQTSIVRSCDTIDSDNTECRKESVKVKEHVKTFYEGGWEKNEVSDDAEIIDQNTFTKVAAFLGLAPKIKDVPSNFEARSVSVDTYDIEPGETKYFKMEIAFPALSSGEFWIEAVGNREYGLLDPFWSSSWDYKLPISIDNTTGAATTEQQVFLELTSAGLTDFWSNVKTDGSDIRFIRENTGNETTWADATYTKRRLLPVTIGTSTPSGGYDGYTVKATINTAALVASSTMLSSCNDLRVFYDTGSSFTEIDRIIHGCNTSTTSVMFALQADHATSTTVNNYYMYYDKPAAGVPPADPNVVYLWYDDVSSDGLSNYTLGRGDTWLGGTWLNSFAYNASGYYTFDTGNNGTEALRVATSTLQERDAYVEAEFYVTACYPNFVAFGALGRYTGTGVGATETSNTYYSTLRAESLLPGCSAGGDSRDGDVVRGAYTTVALDGANPGDITDNQWRKVALSVWDINQANLTYWDIDNAASEPVPGFIAAAPHVTGIDSGADVETTGAWGVMVSDTGGRLRNIVARRYIAPEPVVTSSTTSSYQATSFTELDFWTQHFDHTANRADIWLQVDALPAAASSTVYMYYGNAAATSVSNPYTPFTYSTTTPVFYAVDGSGANQISVVSLIDGNQVRLNNGTPVSLNRGARTTFSTFTASSVISVLGPISATLSSAGGDGSDMLVPVSFATTSFAIPTNRANESWYLYSPFASTTASIFLGAAGTPDQTRSMATGTAAVSTTNPAGSDGVVITAASPILVTQRSSTPGDGLVAYPPTTRDIFGIYSNTIYLSALASASNPTVYCSSGGSATVTGITRGGQLSNTTCTNGAEGAGNAVRYTGAASPITAIQQADSDGNESTTFWPQLEFGTHYAMTNDSAYAAVVCSPRFSSVSLEIRNTIGTVIESGTCTPSGNLPGKAYFTNGTGNGDSVNFTAGHQIVSTNGVPFYAIFEDLTDFAGSGDEKNISGPVQTRKFGATRFNYSFGAQVLNNDARWNQRAFRWYQNINANTPTSSWPIGDSLVVENEAITEAGAVDPGDLLRLRMNMEATVATGTPASTAFILQYAQASTCSLVADTSWLDVAPIGSTTAAFAGYNNAAVLDGAALSVNLLASSTIKGTYEEQNNSEPLPLEVLPGQFIEYDWTLTAANIGLNSDYCFRMVRSNRQALYSYSNYPKLVTSGPPLPATHLLPFDNEHEPDQTPDLEFVAVDISSDDMDFQVQIDDDRNFASINVDRTSETTPLDFFNITTPSDKRPFNSGDRMSFTTPTTLATSTTYWWRVRAKDPSGSNTYGNWSTPTSFTVNPLITVSEWFQTTGHQFSTNIRTNTATTTGSITVTGGVGSITSTPINFFGASIGNAWGSFSWNHTVTSGSALYRIEFYNGSSWSLIPDAALSGNGSGFSSGPVNLTGLDTNIYNQIRVTANYNGTVALNDWKVSWGLRVDTPTLIAPFSSELEPDSTPALTFRTTDPQNDDLLYQVSYSTTSAFTSSSTFASDVSGDFANQTTPADTSPFNSGDTITYTFPSSLTASTTYWWRVRAKDPAGGDSFSPWTSPRSFTIGSTSISTWYQTTKNQFEQNTLTGVTASTSGNVQISSDVGEFGKIVVTNGTWTTVSLQGNYNDPVVVASVRYDRNTGTQRSARVRNKTASSFELLVDNYNSALTGTTTTDYVVMEAGDWTIGDGASGKRVVAGTYEDVSDVQANAYASTGFGQDVPFSPAFAVAPSVLTTVSSDNDSSWVVSHTNDGNDRNNPPTASNLGLYLGRVFETAIHAPEDIDYIAFQRGHGTNNSSQHDFTVSGDVVTNTPIAVNFTSAFGAAPAVLLTQMATVQGANGGIAMVHTGTPATVSAVTVAIDEDGTGADRNHTDEIVAIAAFQNSSGVITRQSGVGSLTGSMVSEPIIFADGSGPKFGTFTWNGTTPGTSTLKYYVEQYSTSTGWERVPDVIIPDNSIGTSTKPIDLSSIDVSTYPQIRVGVDFACGGANCPQVNDWQVTWADGVSMTGTIKEYDRTTTVTSGSVRAYVNGTLVGGVGTVSAGNWTINNVTAFAGDTVTVFVDGAAEADEAVAVLVYDGVGDITGVELFEQHLSISSNEETVVTHADLATLDYSISLDEDIPFEVDGSNNLVVCGQGTCSDMNIYVGPGNAYQPGVAGGLTTTMHDLVNDGTVTGNSNTFTLSGSYRNNAVFVANTSTIVMNATSSGEIMQDISGTLVLHSLTINSPATTTSISISNNLDLSGNLTVTKGTLSRLAKNISVEGSVATAVAGRWFGYGTTTFDGGGTSFWSDASSPSQNIGNAIIDGAIKTINITSNVRATNVTIGANDILNGGTGNIIEVAGNWTNNNTFTAGTSQVKLISDLNGYRLASSTQGDWLNPNWVKRAAVIVQGSQVDSALSNFPVYIDLSTLPSGFWSNVKASGADIRMTSADGITEVPVEVVSISTTTQAGEVYFRAGSLSSATNTVFYLYYGNAAATLPAANSSYGSQNVWSNNYELVYHLSEGAIAGTSTASYLDSTSNLYHGDDRSTATSSAGIVGRGMELDDAVAVAGTPGRADHINIPYQAVDTQTDLTFSAWYKTANSGIQHTLFSGARAAQNNEIIVWLPSNTQFQQYENGSASVSVTIPTVADDNWTQYVTTRNDSADTMEFYVDGIYRGQDTNQPTVAVDVDPNGFVFGYEQDNVAGGVQTTQLLDGSVDEIRIASVVRPTDWVSAEYRTLFSPAAFYAVSAEETISSLSNEVPGHVITSNSQFYRLTMDDATTSASFVNTSVTVQNDFTIATGTITLPTGEIRIGGSFANTGGTFLHNNGRVEFNGTGARTIQQRATAFLNNFYNVTFSSAGSWSFIDTNASTTNEWRMTAGNVTMPSGTLYVGGDFIVAGSAGFTNNNGTVILNADGTKYVQANNSSFNNITIAGSSASAWYGTAWQNRIPVTIQASQVNANLTDFPVYVDLRNLGDAFFTNVNTSGSDIRITDSTGVTEMPYDLVSFSKAAKTGELHFLANTVSSTTNTVFYIYYNNTSAVAYGAADTYGRNSVWDNYEAVYHFSGNPAVSAIDATGNGYDLAPNGTGQATTTGKMGSALDLTLTATGILTDSDWTWSASDDLVSSGWYYQDASSNEAIWQWGTGSPFISFMPWWSGTTGYYRFGNISGSNYAFTRTPSVWNHFTTIGRTGNGNINEIYENAIQRDTVTNNINPTNGGLQIGRYTTAGSYQGYIDELRFSTVIPSVSWIQAEMANQSSTTSFYATSTSQGVQGRIFSDSNVTAVGNFIIQSGGAVLPSGNLNIGGSFDNNSFFSPNNGTVNFNSGAGAETIAAGNSSFVNLTINNAAGDFTVVENATTTGILRLTAANTFVVNPGVTMAVAGTMNMQMPGANTTWTGSTLLFTKTDQLINAKGHSGDTFATVTVINDADVSWWNSSASTYNTLNTGSIYSMDHAAADGALNIYGDYRRATSTEYWNYATDFDGASISGSPRPVTVLVASGSVVRVATNHQVVGTASATTTISAISGVYTLLSNGADITANYFNVSGTNAAGWQLTNATGMLTFTNGAFNIASGTSALTVDASSINANPAAQFYNMNFATAAPSAFNVTTTGEPASYWWFRNGSGNRYGEAFDADSGNPGSIQWDDSQFSLTVAGTVFLDDGLTTATSSICDAISPVVAVAVNGVLATSTPCSPLDGSYSTIISYTGDPEVMAYLNNSAYVASPATVALDTSLSATGTTANGQVIVNRPAVTDGDILIMFFGKDDDPGITASGEWTLVNDLGLASDDQIYSGLWYRPIVDAEEEPAQYSFSTIDNGEGYSYWVGAFSGVDLKNPFEVAPTWSKLINNTVPPAVGTTTTIDGSYALAAWYVDATTPSVTPPGGLWTTIANNIVSPTDTNLLSVAGRVVSPAGFSGSPTISGVGAGRDPQAVQLILRKATFGQALGSATVTKTPVLNSAQYKPNPIVLVGTSTGIVSAVTGGTIAVPRPAIKNGDVLVAFMGKDDGNFGITPPAGWTLIDEINNTTALYSGAWYRVITDGSTEPLTYDFINDDTGTEGHSYWLGAFRGVDVTKPFDVPNTWTEYLNSDTPTATGITTVTNDTFVLAAWFVDADNTVTLPGSPWTARLNNQYNEVGLNIVSKYQPTAGDTGDADVTTVNTTAESNSIQLALRPYGYGVPDRISNFNLYNGRVITRSENGTAFRISDMDLYDSTDDVDVPFTVTLGSPDNLSVRAGTGLFVWPSSIFTPVGNVTLTGGALNNRRDGSLHIGAGASFTAAATQTHTIGGSLYVGASGVLTPSTSSFVFTSTTTGSEIGAAASSTVNFNTLTMNGSGTLSINTPVITVGTTTISNGTLSGISNLTISSGSLTGNGSVNMLAGTVRINGGNTFGGNTPWSFNNLTLGNGSLSGVTTASPVATTTVKGILTISTAHFLAAGASKWNLSGNGNVFVESGSFLEDTSLVQYSGATPNILRTAYYDLSLGNASGTVTALAPTTGLQVLRNLTVGAIGTTTLNLNTNDPLTSVGGLFYIGSRGTVLGSDISQFQAAGSWDNDGVYTANSGTVAFIKSTSTATIAAGNSPFANLAITGAGSFTMTESATTTGSTTISGASTFTLASGQTLAIGGVFANNTNGVNTTWTGSTLSLYGNNAYLISSRADGDNYATVLVASGTHPRIWNSTFGSITTAPNGSLYSMNHNNVVGDLYIFGNYLNNTFADYWNYTEDFDGTGLGGSPRIAKVYIAGGGSASYTGGALYVVGSTTASTTINNQGSGTYSLSIGGTATTSWQYAVPRDISSAGLVFTSSPTVVDFNNNDLLVTQNSASAISVAGTVINKNPARNFNLVGFASSSGVTGAKNVTFSGSAVSSWRFVSALGSIAGESFDVDGGDPGEIVWDDSAALITVSGRVYSDEGSLVSTVCNGVTNSITLRIAGLVSTSTSCAAGTGVYSIPNVSFSPADNLTVYIDGQTQKGVTVSVDPVSNIVDMDIYERRVILRHETADPIRIADLAVWDSSDDADIIFTAVDAGTDTLTLASNNKLIIWANKTFEPVGNVTVSGGGSGDVIDGTIEAYSGATFRAASTQTHEFGGSMLFGAGATFTGASSTVILSSSVTGRTVDVNNSDFYNLNFTGSGDWVVTDNTLTVRNDLNKTGGVLTLPTATTTIGGDFENTGGTFVANGGRLIFTATDAGNQIAFGGSSANIVTFTGSGTFVMADTNATTTGSFTIQAGTVTLPSNSLTVGGNFSNALTSTLLHNNGSLIMSSTTGTSTITQAGDDLNSLTIAGNGKFVMTDGSATLRNNLTVASGTLFMATNTLSIAGSLDAINGVMVTASGTVQFNAATTGKVVNPGTNSFYNVVITNAAGGWTFASATTTNNFSLVAANTFTQSSASTLSVGGVFTNTVGGANTTWTGSTLLLRSSTNYTANTKAAGADVYATLVATGNTDVRFWNSSFATTTLSASSSLYSQDHSAVDGALRIFGDFTIGTTTEYWNYANDFDGTVLSGGLRRAVNVTFDDLTSSSLHMTSGTLTLTGVSTASTTVTASGSYTHPFVIKGGAFNGQYYSFNKLNTNGLVLNNSVAVSNLSNGIFTQAANSASLISLDTATLNANASLIINFTNFLNGGFTGGINVNLTATSTSAWQFKDHAGNLSGEAYDVDGVDACGSIRWDDSSCLLLDQVGYRWRNDDGGLGAPSSEWFNVSWGKRARVRLENGVNSTYTNTAVEVTVPYDADMQADFDDLRFTDVTGVTQVPYWIETYTSGVSAKVWLKVASLPAKNTAHFFMYYDNVSATTTSSSSAVFQASDTFEDSNITEYSGDSFYEASTGQVYGGSYGVAPKVANKGNRANTGIARFDQTVASGSIIRYRQYVNTSTGFDDESCTLFAVQSPVTLKNNYGVCLELFGTDRFVLARNVESTDSFGAVVVMSSSTVTYTTGWYEVLIDWQSGGLINASLYNPSGTLVATTSATNTAYGSGGFGVTSWGQNGGWDSIVAYPRVAAKPTVYFGAEQVSGGASWNQPLNTPGSNFTIGSPTRLRFALQNTGLDLTSQLFRLEFAPKGAAPSCDAIGGGSYAEVPNISSCGTSGLCMATSSNVVNNETTVDLLTGAKGGYTLGQAIESPSSQTNSFNLNAQKYTEIEYVLTPTINVSDEAYCLRVTDGGTELDAYGEIAEMSLEFEPSLGPVQFNQGNPVVLSIGTTTSILATTSVTDLNGYADLVAATTTFYKSDVAGLASCTPDNNNCYRSTIGNGCSYTACTGNSCTLQCSAPFAYHTDPTDADGGVFWYAYVEVEDSTNNSNFGTSPANDVTTLRAINVSNSISYGSIGVNADTGAFNPTTDLFNLGNEAIDVQVSGTDLSDGAVSVIETEEQKFATSTFTYSSCTFCSSLTEIGTALEVDLSKPTIASPLVSDQLFWGIYVPFGTNSAAHTGINTFMATGD